MVSLFQRSNSGQNMLIILCADKNTVGKFGALQQSVPVVFGILRQNTVL